MEIEPKKATVTYSSKGFWWPQPQEEPREEWIQRQKDLENEKCTIVL